MDLASGLGTPHYLKQNVKTIPDTGAAGETGLGLKNETP